MSATNKADRNKISVSIKFSFDRRAMSADKTAEIFDAINRLLRRILSPSELRGLADQLHGKVKRMRRAKGQDSATLHYPREARR